jgi:hypothetical protein
MVGKAFASPTRENFTATGSVRWAVQLHLLLIPTQEFSDNKHWYGALLGLIIEINATKHIKIGI